MMSTAELRNHKRLRPEAMSGNDVLRKAREIWNRDPHKQRSVQTEELDFRQFFGCGVLVCLKLWNLLMTKNFLPSGGTIEHLLWSLMFLKTYGKQKVLCSLAGGVSVDTFWKWTWMFISAIAELENVVVSVRAIGLCIALFWSSSASTISLVTSS